jgi:hypothetical protein
MTLQSLSARTFAKQASKGCGEGTKMGMTVKSFQVNTMSGILTIGFAYISEPLFMIPEAHKHDFDQYLFFISGDSKNFVGFDADIELTLDGVVKTITYPCYVFIPKGMLHCPSNIKRVTKPLVFIDARLSKEASIRPASPGTI